jgi:hypothetical protein
MTDEAVKSRRLIGLALLGTVLFNYPILSLFNRDILLFGIPLPVLYMFGTWGMLILLAALITRGGHAGVSPADDA